MLSGLELNVKIPLGEEQFNCNNNKMVRFSVILDNSIQQRISAEVTD